MRPFKGTTAADRGAAGTRFRDRRDAGERLAAQLADVQLHDPLVLALPRGGVPVAFEIARVLDAPLDVYVARKVGAPTQPEFGIGAIAERGTVIAREDVLALLRIDDERFARLADAEREELARRVQHYRGERQLPDVRAHDVVLVDDGLATGVTARAAAADLRAAGSRRLLLAVPVCAVEAATELGRIVDEVVCVLRPPDLSSVGEWYRDFSQTSDAEVMELLSAAHRHRDRHSALRAGEAGR